MNKFNGLQSNALLSGFVGLQEQMADMEGLIVQADSAGPFAQVVCDLVPAERRVLHDQFAHLRREMQNLLELYDIPIHVQPISLRWALLTRSVGMHVAIDELSPARLRGYGTLTEAGAIAIERIQQQLSRHAAQIDRFLSQRADSGYAKRLARLERAVPDLTAALQTIAEVVNRRGLVEFRPPLELILHRLEHDQLEIAVFGRVSSGKSSLLNHLAECDLLPVGITPVTAVPTRLTWGETPEVIVDTIESHAKRIAPSDIIEYASEERNPGNVRHVTRIEARLPSSRLRDGVVFVDTPGIGSLARGGGDETLAYLPQCDLGVVLLDGSSTLNNEDVELIRLLTEAGTPVQVLLSKADLLPEDQRRRMTEYVAHQLREQLEAEFEVYPVSIVGPDEAMLKAWFEREIAPLSERHCELSRTSTRRKTARLAESLIAALERARRRGSGQGDSRNPERFRNAATLLQAGDDQLRKLHTLAREWRYESVPDADRVARRAADTIVAAGSDGVDPSAAVRHAFAEEVRTRGQTARRHLLETQSELSRVLRTVGEAFPQAAADDAAIRESAFVGLPIPEWRPPPNVSGSSLPWWTSFWENGARGWLGAQLLRRFGPTLRDVFAEYDRRLESWLIHGYSTLAASFEASTEVVRRWIADSGTETEMSEGSATDVEQDLSQLRSIFTTPTSRVDVTMKTGGLLSNGAIESSATEVVR